MLCESSVNVELAIPRARFPAVKNHFDILGNALFKKMFLLRVG